MWMFYAFASAFFAGATAILVKVGIRRVDSNLATAVRTVVVVVFAWLMVAVAGSYRELPAIGAKTLAFLVLSGLATGGSWMFYFKALQMGDINVVVPIDKSSTVLAMLLAVLFLGEALDLQKILCMLLIGSGTYLMVEKKQAESTAAEEAAPKRSTWIAYAFLAAFFGALTGILGKIGIEGVESNLGMAIRTVVVVVMAWTIVLWQGRQRQLREIDRRSWAFLVLSGLATGLSWLCYYRALQQGPASVVVPIDKLSILVSVAFARIVLGERLRRRSVVGLALLVSGTLGLLL